MQEEFNTEKAQRYCADSGLLWDESGAAEAIKLARRHKWTNDVLNDATICHTDTLVRIFTPANYTWPQRLMWAGMWLGVLRSPGRN